MQNVIAGVGQRRPRQAKVMPTERKCTRDFESQPGKIEHGHILGEQVHPEHI